MQFLFFTTVLSTVCFYKTEQYIAAAAKITRAKLEKINCLRAFNNYVCRQNRVAISASSRSSQASKLTTSLVWHRFIFCKRLDQDLTFKNGIKDSHLEVNTSKKLQMVQFISLNRGGGPLQIRFQFSNGRILGFNQCLKCLNLFISGRLGKSVDIHSYRMPPYHDSAHFRTYADVCIHILELFSDAWYRNIQGTVKNFCDWNIWA